MPPQPKAPVAFVILAIVLALLQPGRAVRRRLHRFLRREVYGKIMYPGKNASGDREADPQQYEPGERRIFGFRAGQSTTILTNLSLPVI